MQKSESRRVYRFLDEWALDKERTRCFENLITAIVQRAVDDYKEKNEYAYSAWRFLRNTFPRCADLEKPDLERTRKQTYLHEDDEITIF